MNRWLCAGLGAVVLTFPLAGNAQTSALAAGRPTVRAHGPRTAHPPEGAKRLGPDHRRMDADDRSFDYDYDYDDAQLQVRPVIVVPQSFFVRSATKHRTLKRRASPKPTFSADVFGVYQNGN